jgi:hypothetical protein
MKATRTAHRRKPPSLSTPVLVPTLPAPSSPSSPPIGEAVRVGVPASPSFSLGGASGIDSDTSDLTSLPTVEEEWSTKARIDQDAALGESKFNYENVKWERLPGFNRPYAQLIGKLSSGMWKLGVPTEHTATHHRWWLCTACHSADAVDPPKHHYNINKGSSSVSGHLRDVHGQSWNEKGQIIPCGRKGTPIPAGLDSNKPREQIILNELSKEFDEAHFRRLLVRWIVYDNVSFRQVDCEAFREFVTYLSPRAAQALPTDKTIRRWIMKGYDMHKAAVKEALQGAVSKIHIAFDLWTSSNCLSLNGIVAHFIDAKFESRAILLATPEQNESHMGVEIADQVISVIEDFNIGDNLGFFVLDNASNNDTAMQAIGNRFGFDPQERRLRCAGHVINLIARHLLFGFDKNLFELEESLPVNLKEELKRWRRSGPVGKAHNLIVWTYASPQRRKRWHEGKLLSSVRRYIHVLGYIS